MWRAAASCRTQEGSPMPKPHSPPVLQRGDLSNRFQDEFLNIKINWESKHSERGSAGGEQPWGAAGGRELQGTRGQPNAQAPLPTGTPQGGGLQIASGINL